MTTIASATDLPFEEAIDFLKAKANVTSESYLDVQGRANVKSFTVAGATTDALVGDFRREVARALEQGTSLKDFHKSFDGLVTKHGWEHTGKPGWRSRVIYETNLGTAYAAGRYKQQTEPETLAAFPYWQYVHSGAKHPRPQHLAWNGVTLRADDAFWDTHYPPNGWGCGCRTRPVSARGLQRMGKSGPDAAPEIKLKPYTNKKTGKTSMVPEGIDPGFEYNVGQEWAGLAEVPATATMRAPEPVVPPALTPLAPSPPAPLSRPARPRPPPAGSDDELTTVRLPGEPGGRGEVIPPQPDEAVETFARRVLDGEINDRAASIVAGRMPAELTQHMALAGGRPLEVSAFRVLKVAGRAEEMGGAASAAHPEVTARDWARIQEILNFGQAWLDPKPATTGGQPQLHLIQELDGRKMMLVVRSVKKPGGGSRLIVPSFQEVGERRMARLARRLLKIERVE